jgi:ACS family sodium-dependent inorganic phosphate cotransporter-like MFS transporter 6/7/8
VWYALSYSKSEDEKGFAGGDGELGTPESLPEPERPPLRHIDKYVRPECPCLSKRYTVAVLTCIGTV